MKIYKKIETKEPRERPIRSGDSQELFPERLWTIYCHKKHDGTSQWMGRLLLFNFFFKVLTQIDVIYQKTKNIAFLTYILHRHTLVPMRETEDMDNKIAIIQKLFQNKLKKIFKTKNKKFILLSIRYSPLKNEASKKITHFFIGFSNH